MTTSAVCAWLIVAAARQEADSLYAASSTEVNVNGFVRAGGLLLVRLA
jgi:hypothetical protein